MITLSVLGYGIPALMILAREYVHVTFDHVGEEAARRLARQCGKKPKTIDQWMQSFRKGLADHNNY